MSLIFATQLTAVATALLAAFAIVTAFYARQAFRKQSQEVSAIEQQVKDQRELTEQQGELLKVQSGQLELQRQQLDDQRAERRRAQASRVFIWTETGPDPRLTDAQIEKGVPWRETVTVRVKNTSDQPIYSAELVWDDGSTPLTEVAARSGAERLPVVLMPGSDVSETREPGLETRAVTMRFRDAAGITWLRGPEGDLVDLSSLAETERAERLTLPRSLRGQRSGKHAVAILFRNCSAAASATTANEPEVPWPASLRAGGEKIRVAPCR
jgi:hypothetical protein